MSSKNYCLLQNNSITLSSARFTLKLRSSALDTDARPGHRSGAIGQMVPIFCNSKITKIDRFASALHSSWAIMNSAFVIVHCSRWLLSTCRPSYAPTSCIELRKRYECMLVLIFHAFTQSNARTVLRNAILGSTTFTMINSKRSTWSWNHSVVSKARGVATDATYLVKRFQSVVAFWYWLVCREKRAPLLRLSAGQPRWVARWAVLVQRNSAAPALTNRANPIFDASIGRQKQGIEIKWVRGHRYLTIRVRDHLFGRGKAIERTNQECFEGSFARCGSLTWTNFKSSASTWSKRAHGKRN